MAAGKMAVLILAVSVMAGCQMYGMYGSMSGPVKGSGWTSGNTASAAISGYAFSPSSFSFPGANNVTVTWTNYDNVTHTVTSDNGAFTSSGNITQGTTYSVTFPSPGTYSYHCSIHTYMTGTITVN